MVSSDSIAFIGRWFMMDSLFPLRRIVEVGMKLMFESYTKINKRM